MEDNSLSNHELLQAVDNAPAANAPTVEDNEAEVTSKPPRQPDGKFASRNEDEPPADGAEDDTIEASETDDAETGESDDAESDEQRETRPKKHTPWQRRVSQLTAQKHEAEARAREAERRNFELEQLLAKEIDPNLEFENPAQFQTETIRRALAEQKREDLRDEYARSQEAKFRADQAIFMERLDEFKDELPDFDQVVFDNGNITIDTEMVSFLASSDIGPKIAHHLGKNPSLSHRIAALPPAQKGAELARLEAKLATPPPKRTTKAPKPARAIQQSGSSGTFNVQTASVDDLKRRIYGG